LADCSNFPGVFPPEGQGLFLSEGGGVFRLAESNDFECFELLGSEDQTDSEAPSASPAEETLLTLSVNARMTLTLQQGHAGDIVDSTEVLMPMEQTEAYVRNILSKEYADALDSIQLTDIAPEDLAINDSNKFVLSFTVQVSFGDLDAMIQTRVLAQLLSSGENLNFFAGNYARYTDLGEPNGIFYFAYEVHWRLTGSPTVNS